MLILILLGGNELSLPSLPCCSEDRLIKGTIDSFIKARYEVFLFLNKAQEV